MRTSSLVPVLLALLPACNVAAGDAFHDYVGDPSGGEGSSTTSAESEGDGATGPISTVTTSPPAESEGDASTTGDTEGTDGDTTEAVTTAGDPPGPPRIVGDPQITPNPIMVGGLVEVVVEAEDADAVTMTLVESGDELALAPGDAPGIFVGAIEAFTGVDNGWHDVVLTPARGEVDGDFVVASYEIALPKPGTEGFWETGDLIGPGQVAGVGILPGGDIVELGNYTPGGEHRCYLRRRDPNGAWAPSDLVELLPGVECDAVDVKVSSDGAIFALVRRQTNSGILWWLGELPAWGAEVKSRGLGVKGEEVYALAERGGTVAVCGTAPTQQPDEVDVLIQVFQPNLPGQRTVLGYTPEEEKPNHFRETARDCVLTDAQTLVSVGDAFGKHVKDDPERSRRFTLTHHLSGGLEPEWIVPETGLVTQSFATAVDVTDDGNVLSVGYICGDDCNPEGWIWLEEPGGALEWQLSLGLFTVEALAPHDVRWSPAKHAIVASGGLKGDETAFLVRAYKPNESLLWTYKRKDVNVLHLALTLAVGPFGEVWVGGFGANGYPAVANVHR